MKVINAITAIRYMEYAIFVLHHGGSIDIVISRLFLLHIPSTLRAFTLRLYVPGGNNEISSLLSIISVQLFLSLSMQYE